MADRGPSADGGRDDPGARARWGALTLGLTLFVLYPGQTRVLDDAWADEAPARGTARHAPALVQAQAQAEVATPDAPLSQVDALTERMHGMEGKLKESAAARKSADQARMEAERRLAEATQETARRNTEIEQLREAKADLETLLKRAGDQYADAVAQLATAAEQVRGLTGETLALTRRTADLEQQVEQLSNDQRRNEADYRDRLRGAQEAQSELRAQLLERDGVLARLNAELGAAKTQREALEDRLKTLSAQVPAPAGGALTLEAAQARSAAAAAALRDALTRADGSGDAQPRRAAVREAEQALHRCQFAVAQVADAFSVYRVRPADTLVLIANHIYGDGARWRAIREANRHVLPDPDRLTPGLTLVIP